MSLLFTIALDVKQGDDIMEPASQRPKRRHGRPHVLDSDEDEGKEEDNTHQDEEIISEKVDLIAPVDDDLQILVDWIYFILKCSNICWDTF